MLATAPVPWRADAVDIVRCRECGSVVISAVQPASTYTDADWDWYIEHIAGVEAIAGILARADTGPGARMLDIGCGYGFGLDVGERLFGWTGIGLDPSVAAKRGREELGLDIRPGTLDDAFEPDEVFDVIFASEVLEHVPDPREFLAAVHRRLSGDGVFLMTTPDAAYVDPETPLTALYPVLSVGNHEFLVDAAGLERLLTGAGFVARVWHEGPSLAALAARSVDALQGRRPDARVDLLDVARYCGDRAEDAPVDSALALGMGARGLKLTTNLAAFDHTLACLPGLSRSLEARYGITLDDPEAAAGLPDPRTVLVVVHYFAGMLALSIQQEPRRAARHFGAAADVARRTTSATASTTTPRRRCSKPSRWCTARSRSPASTRTRFPPRSPTSTARSPRGAGDEELVAACRELVDEETARGELRSRSRQALRKVRAYARRVVRPG